MFINLDDVTTEMITTSDVKDRMGRILVPKGTTLNEAHLRGMKMWGVLGIEVEGEDVSDERSLASEISEERRSEIERLFLHNDMKQPVTQALFDVCLLKRL